MSDFDTVLERLLLDPLFKSALARDPARTLAGYELSDEERQVLHAQMAGAGGAQSLVEDRISKSSVFGLVSSLSGGFGNVAEYEEIALGGDTGTETVSEYEEIAGDVNGDAVALKGDVNGDAVALKEVDPMPVPHEADSPGAIDPPEGGSPVAFDPPDPDSPSDGPTPHMLVDPTTPTPDGDELKIGFVEDKIAPADMKIATADLRVVIPPDLPSS